MVNGSEVNIPKIGGTVQKVLCGAAVHLTPEVIEHGICFIHPDIPLFKMYIGRDPKTGKILHKFEVCQPLFPEITKFSIHVVEGENAMPSEVASPEGQAVTAEAPKTEEPQEATPKSSLIIP